jgi:hypothetical protein
VIGSHLIRRWRGRLAVSFGGAGTVLSGAPFLSTAHSVNGVDPFLFVPGLMFLSAGLLVLHSARQPSPARAAVDAVISRRLTAAEALQQRKSRAGEREVLIDALAAAAATFYSIAGELPVDVSHTVLRRADDLRELVWLNRAG